jgi:class 3 adenylate cyclase
LLTPETRYARSGEVHIAYQVIGDGPIDLIYVPTWISQVEHYWEEPRVASFFGRLASFSRLIMFDRRGSGLSDPMPRAPTLEEQMDDVVAVMEAADSERAGVFAQFEAGAMAALFAATHPERTTALMLYEATPRASWAPDYDWALRKEDRLAYNENSVASWGDGSRLRAFAPRSGNNEHFRRWFARLERLSASPGTAASLLRMHGEVDVRSVLPTIKVPTLVLHREGDQLIDIRHSRYLVEHIPGARYVGLPGDEALTFAGGADELLDEIEEFLTGVRPQPESERILSTVMFSDIVDSTSRAAELGDRRWRDLLESIEGEVMSELERFRGRAVKAMGDGFLSTFDGPARGIRCATAIREAARAYGVEVRSGLHTGEIEVMGDDVGGLAVHIGARVSAIAAPGEVLVSGTVRDLVVGSGIAFADRGTCELRGVPGEWRLFAVED